jgi:hypothetical protein
MGLDQYKDIFGKPGEDVHKIRIPIFDWALLDTSLVILIVFIFYLFGYKRFILIFIILFFLGQEFHYIFGVQTAFIKQVSYLVT